MKFSIAFYVDSVPFTASVVDGTASLGGSESACLGTARALQARGHQVSIYANKLDPGAAGLDRWGVRWYPSEELREPDGHQDWDVFCSLRMPSIYYRQRTARLRLIWNQDLMNADPFKAQIMAHAWAYDKVLYVSEYHRRQWEEWLPELKPLGHVTRNSFDPANLPTSVNKDPYRIIHISRPERGLEPLLRMWPLLKREVPQATLQICRYSSMYDKDGWGEVCKNYDGKVEQINKITGGITLLGELGKKELYQAISDAGVMWYPGVPTFAETSCIASIEAQACGTVFVGSLKGALPETVPSGILIPGDAFSKDYQRESVESVVDVMRGCAENSADYQTLVEAGRKHVLTYTHDAVAADWEQWIEHYFQERYQSNKLGVLRQLMHYDDHTAAKHVAGYIMAVRDCYRIPGTPAPEVKPGLEPCSDAEYTEASDALSLCHRVIAGEEQKAETYAEFAADPLIEAERSDRFKAVIPKFANSTHVLDLACGPGSFSLALAKARPDIKITAIDYSEGNITVAKKAAEAWGVAEQCTFITAPVYDFATQTPSKLPPEVAGADGAFIGEFLEHVADAPAMVDAVESVLQLNSPVVYSVPNGPLVELHGRNIPRKRGHVHHFGVKDVQAMFGQKKDLDVAFLGWVGVSPKGNACGNWLISYRTSKAPTGQRPYEHQIVTTRPYARLSVGIIASESEFEIAKCLANVWGLADEIVVGLCGSTDRTREICEQFDQAYLESKIRVVSLPAVTDLPDGFAEARNTVLKAATGDWFLWMDTDESLIGGHTLGKYLEGGPYNGYVIRQNHLQLDAPNHYDVPTRLFRRCEDIQFYGVVHEQPQMGDCNGDITPALEASDCQIAHTGYIDASVRRQKLFERNLPLVVRDQDRFPDRRLGKLLVARDCVHLGDETCRQAGDTLTGDAESYYRRAIEIFTEHFADPGDKFHELARPFYERALQALGEGTEVEWALAGKPGGLNGTHAKPHRFWVLDDQELKVIVEHRLSKAYLQMNPTPVHVDPYPTEAIH